ncbi:MAG: hypothetical protein MZV64_25135 [Ignavibacteriales bacterium]|nr:hypothetical protein [Ignavibacteriales bacterium]
MARARHDGCLRRDPAGRPWRGGLRHPAKPRDAARLRPERLPPRRRTGGWRLAGRGEAGAGCHGLLGRASGRALATLHGDPARRPGLALDPGAPGLGRGGGGPRRLALLPARRRAPGGPRRSSRPARSASPPRRPAPCDPRSGQHTSRPGASSWCWCRPP